MHLHRYLYRADGYKSIACLRHLFTFLRPLLRSVLLSAPLDLFLTDFAEDINTPADGEVESIVPVELVERLKFLVRDDEVYRDGS